MCRSVSDNFSCRHVPPDKINMQSSALRSLRCFYICIGSTVQKLGKKYLTQWRDFYIYLVKIVPWCEIYPPLSSYIWITPSWPPRLCRHVGRIFLSDVNSTMQRCIKILQGNNTHNNAVMHHRSKASLLPRHLIRSPILVSHLHFTRTKNVSKFQILPFATPEATPISMCVNALSTVWLP